MANDKSIYDLKLHDVTRIKTSTEVIRVPNGWIYSIVESKSIVFVPYHTEFEPKRKCPDCDTSFIKAMSNTGSGKIVYMCANQHEFPLDNVTVDTEWVRIANEKPPRSGAWQVSGYHGGSDSMGEYIFHYDKDSDMWHDGDMENLTNCRPDFWLRTPKSPLVS